MLKQNGSSQKEPDLLAQANRRTHTGDSKGPDEDYLFSEAAMLDCSPTGPLQSLADGGQKDGAAKSSFMRTI